MGNRWQSKIDALIHLSRDKGAMPVERETATRKLRQITRDHPQAMDYRPLAEFTMRDLGEMRQRGISTAGSWDETIALMVADYRARLERGRAPSVPPAMLLFDRLCSFGDNEKRTPRWARK